LLYDAGGFQLPANNRCVVLAGLLKGVIHCLNRDCGYSCSRARWRC
jgi:hypothetical protein